MGETWIEYRWNMDEMWVKYRLNMGENNKYGKFGIFLYGYVYFIIWNIICENQTNFGKNSRPLQDKNKENILHLNIFMVFGGGIWGRFSN